MTNKLLPIGIQDFPKLISNNFLYVDKTEYVYRCITKGNAYFLSRPRRFGKSLFLSTIESVFLNKKELFEGLWIHNSNYDWQEYPVIRLDMSSFDGRTLDKLEIDIIEELRRVAINYNVSIDFSGSVMNIFKNLLIKLSEIKPVVVLIDEYDKPLLNCLNKSYKLDVSETKGFLKDFYGVLKSSDKYLKFVFLTGISKFSKVSIFSGLNHLSDLTMMAEYAAIAGYTKEELLTHFEENIQNLSKKLRDKNIFSKITKWYNGYRFSEENITVYNPFSILSLFHSNRFKNYWFETGTPTFLIDLLKKYNQDLQALAGTGAQSEDFSTYEIESLNILPLLYQTGYLTIKDYDPSLDYFTLDYPNYEVRRSFLSALLSGISELKEPSTSFVIDLNKALLVNDMESFFKTLQRFFAHIPYELQIKSELYYQNIIYVLFTLIGLNIDAEVHTNVGRIDATLKYKNRLYIFEFKLDKSAEIALDQIKEKKYYQKYCDDNTKVYMLGVNFSTKERNIANWVIATL